MKKLLFAIVLTVLLSPILCLSDSKTYSSVESDIASVEETAGNYQDIIINLNSQGAYAAKSIKLLSDMKDLIWQSKMLLSEQRLDEAAQTLGEAKLLAPRITLDVTFSFKINKGRLALEEASALISKAEKEGYDIKALEGYYDQAGDLLAQAKSSYDGEDYEAVDPKISQIMSLAESVSKGADSLDVVQAQQPSGFAIGLSNAGEPNYWWIGGILAVILVAIILKTRKSVKKLNQVSRLEIIKNRMR
jgi:hypothetical protein